uniref:Mutator-like transposase domain-containing protein n=1 Tax=Magallana gigas TaxID=29159 RepID=K1RKT7_MAGGI
MTELNKLDINDKIQKVKEVNVTRGHPENIINISTDARYNSSVMFNPKTLGQNASQAFSLAVETNTDRKYILACAVQNKLCWTGAWLRGKGMEVDCLGGHAECTANLSPAALFSEYEMGKDIGIQLGPQDVLVRYVTEDNVAQGAKGVDDAMRALHPLWKVERLADAVHLGQSQFHASNRAVYSDEMFHSKTKEEKKELQMVFGNDLKSRCSMIVIKRYSPSMTETWRK